VTGFRYAVVLVPLAHTSLINVRTNTACCACNNSIERMVRGFPVAIWIC
jgi:hypothetical protein